MPSAVNVQDLRRRKKRAMDHPLNVSVSVRSRRASPRDATASSPPSRSCAEDSSPRTPPSPLPILRRRFVSAHALLLLGHRRRLDYGARYRHDEVPDHRLAEAKRTGEFVERLLVALDIHQHVMCFVDLGDRIRKLPAGPVLETMDPAPARGDHAPVPLDHRRNLLALVRVDQKHDLVMTHRSAPCGCSHPKSKKPGVARSYVSRQVARTRWGGEE